VSSEQGAAGIDKSATGNQMVTAADKDIQDFCKNIVASWNKPVSIPETFLEIYQWKKIVGELAERINNI
jgi:hypothetical protein